MVAKTKSDLARLLADVPAPLGVGLKPWDRGKRVATWLDQNGPRDTNEINAAFPGNRSDLLDLLKAMVEASYLCVDEKRYDGRAKNGKVCRQPNLYRVDVPPIRAAATLARKRKSTDPLANAPKELRELFLRIDLAHPGVKKAGIRTEHRLWRVAQFVCAVYPRRVALLGTLAKEIGLDSRDGVKPIQVSAIAAGWVKQPTPELKGQIGRPANDYEVQLARIKKHAKLGEPRASLGPQRSTDSLGELMPTVDRRTREQRRWVAALEPRWEETGLETIKDWEAYKNLLWVVGPGIASTYRKLGKELGAQSTTPVEKYVRRATKVGLFDRTNLKKGGVKITPTDRLEALAGDLPKPKSTRKAKATANGQAGTNGHVTAVGANIAPGQLSTESSNAGRQREWDDECAFAEKHLAANPKATYRECLEAFCRANPDRKLPGNHTQLKAAIHYRRKVAAKQNLAAPQR